jgi:(2Fe-2S) ferredoxin
MAGERRERKDQQAVRLFSENKDKWFTAVQINGIVRTSDARKIISNLIKKGYPIEKQIIDKETGTKAYRLVWPYHKPPKQLSLF